MVKRKFKTGDLVTFRKDLLGPDPFLGVVLDIFYNEEDGQTFVKVIWTDGYEWLELAETIKLVARADKSGRSKIRKK